MGQVLSQGPLFLLCLIVMMSIVIIVHELGHYYAGRHCGAQIRSYSIGFGKPIFEKIDSRGTRWRISQVPFGGYVMFPESVDGVVDEAHAGIIGKPINELTPWQRIYISLAGPAANFVLAIGIFTIFFLTFGRYTSTTGIETVQPDSPAARAGFESGDVVVTAGGRKVTGMQDVRRAILLNPNTPVTFVVSRDGAMVDVTVRPEEVRRENDFGQVVPQAQIGIVMKEIGLGEHIRYNPFQAVGVAVNETRNTVSDTATILTRIATGKMSVHSMSGPIAIGDISRRVVKTIWDVPELTVGQKLYQIFWRLFALCAAISIGVGFFNLLPLPVLDGGSVVSNLYQGIVGRAVPEIVRAMTYRAGLLLLLAFAAFITIGDVLETGVFGAGQ